MLRFLCKTLFSSLFILYAINIDVYGEDVRISRDSALSIAIEYLNGDLKDENNIRNNVNIKAINLHNSISPYFRKFLDGKDAWEITFSNDNPILREFNKPEKQKQLELKLYIDQSTGLLLKITCWMNSTVLSKEASEKVENGILLGRFHYSGISKITLIPFTEIFPKIPADIYMAGAIEAFAMESKAEDGSTKTYWHIILYDYPTQISIPPSPENRPSKYRHLSGTIKVRKDVIFDGTTGKIISDMELK